MTNNVAIITGSPAAPTRSLTRYASTGSAKNRFKFEAAKRAACVIHSRPVKLIDRRSGYHHLLNEQTSSNGLRTLLTGASGSAA